MGGYGMRRGGPPGPPPMRIPRGPPVNMGGPPRGGGRGMPPARGGMRGSGGPPIPQRGGFQNRGGSWARGGGGNMNSSRGPPPPRGGRGGGRGGGQMQSGGSGRWGSGPNHGGQRPNHGGRVPQVGWRIFLFAHFSQEFLKITWYIIYIYRVETFSLGDRVIGEVAEAVVSAIQVLVVGLEQRILGYINKYLIKALVSPGTV